MSLKQNDEYFEQLKEKEDEDRACMTSVRKCVDCKQDKAPTEFSFRYNKVFHKKLNRTVREKYLNSICKACIVVRSFVWQKKNAARYKKYLSDWWKKRGRANKDKKNV